MSRDLRRNRIETPLGVLTLSEPPEPDEATRPVLLVVLGPLMRVAAVNRMAEVFGDLAHVAIAELPVRGPEALPCPNAPRLAALLGAALHRRFLGRAVTLMAFGDAAIVARGVQAPEVVRLIAVEPPVRSALLWPLSDQLRAMAATPDPQLRAFVADIYGEGGPKPGPRDHTSAFSGLVFPVDLVAGDLPLMPRRPLDRMPSLISEKDREALGRSVAVHLAAGAGNNIVADAPAVLVGLLKRVLPFAATSALGAESLARRLAAAAPRDASRVRYEGPAHAAFAAAYLSVNPRAMVVAAGEGGGASDLIVAQHGGGPTPQSLARDLAPGGRLLATAPLGDARASLATNLEAAGLTLLHDDPVITPPATALVRAVRGAAPAPLHVEMIPFARLLMDIRTRLPTDALRTDPGADVTYLAPPFVPRSPAIRPGGVVIIQRLTSQSPSEMWSMMAGAIRSDHVIVLEYDDHPELVSQMVRGRGLTDDEWEICRVVHGIQTTNDLLVEMYRQYNPEVVAFPNAVFDLPPIPAGPRAHRVFYGGVTRGPFAVEVARALGPAIKACPDVEFVVAGDRAFFDALPTSRKVFSDYVPYERYLALMASCSINLSPLKPRPMMQTKSDAKYLDAARCGALMIASPTVYERVIRPGENGLIAADLDDWPRLLVNALQDQTGRERMARQAWEEVRANRMFAYQICDRLAWYRSLSARRHDLNRALLERRPQVAAALARMGN